MKKKKRSFYVNCIVKRLYTHSNFPSPILICLKIIKDFPFEKRIIFQMKWIFVYPPL